MRTKFYLFAFVLTVFMSCQEDEGLSLTEIPVQAQNKLIELYPTATNIQWKSYYSQYHVTFNRILMVENTAYSPPEDTVKYFSRSLISDAKFTNGGDWLLTKTPITYSDLPEQVVDSLRESQFKNWVIKEQSLEDSPKFNKKVGDYPYGELYRLVMYDNTKIRPLYFRDNGTPIDKARF